MRALVTGAIAGFAVAATMTFIDWQQNPGGIFHDASGTRWPIVYETFLSWFLPIFVAATPLAWLARWPADRKQSTAPDPRAFPAPLAALHRLPFEYEEDGGIDFEPYRSFMDPGEATDWFRAWTGNEDVDAGSLRVFGQDGTGGMAAFWVIRPDRELLEQPVVFLGSEGELGVVANTFGDYVWLLANGIGPYEAVAYGAGLAKGNRLFRRFAEAHAPGAEREPAALIEHAQSEFPDFEDSIRALCK